MLGISAVCILGHEQAAVDRDHYTALYVLPRGALRTELLAALRQARKTRRPRARGRDRRGQIPNIRPIADRPTDVASRTVPGHWEGDRLKGTRTGSAVGTLVERTTRLVLLARMDGTDAASAYRGFTKTLRHVPAPLRKTLTYNQGKEMAEHERLAHRLSIQVFFADPHSPWQQGTNENTNGLLRQYLPKGTDLSGYTQRKLNAIAHRVNTRPRKCLDFATPLKVYAQLCAHSLIALGNLKPPLVSSLFSKLVLLPSPKQWTRRQVWESRVTARARQLPDWSVRTRESGHHIEL